jgi:hypothetical protein
MLPILAGMALEGSSATQPDTAAARAKEEVGNQKRGAGHRNVNQGRNGPDDDKSPTLAPASGRWTRKPTEAKKALALPASSITTTPRRVEPLAVITATEDHGRQVPDDTSER